MNDQKDSYRTTFLFATPSFARGVGTIFNIWGNYYDYNISKTPQEADFRAIESDWGMVGQDIKNAFEK